MGNIVIVGVQWGDEGKGRIVDQLAAKSDIVDRFQGGNNAGHTLENKFKIVLHQIPSGICYPEVMCIAGSGMVINPIALLAELDSLEKLEIDTSNFFISRDANINLGYHQLLDELKEKKGKGIGTTKKGIGFAYADFIKREGLKFLDLFDEKAFVDKLRYNVDINRKIINAVYGNVDTSSLDRIVDDSLVWRQQLIGRVANTKPLLRQAIEDGKNVLFEGQLGVMRDLHSGIYPYVTSSSVGAAGVCAYEGIPINSIDEIVGVIKAYSSFVGDGPFPVKLTNDIGEKIRDLGNEVGATTQRKREVGWIDLFSLKHAQKITGFHWAVLTHLDILSHFKDIPVCTGYKLNGKEVTEFPTTQELYDVEPVYHIMKGWETDISNITSFDDLPEAAKDYVKFIQDQSGIPIRMITVGSKRDQTIYL